MYSLVQQQLEQSPRVWLVTGVAGFIGSNLLEKLLSLNQKVIGLDNFSTGSMANIQDALNAVTSKQRDRFSLIEGDISDYNTCLNACSGVNIVLHQAALGSVPRSLSDPIATNRTNIDGFLNLIRAAQQSGIKRFVYASSSSVYGDHPGLPKVEEVVGNPVSPYAVSKVANELYARVFSLNYGIHCIGLRYFNVFGRRQNPLGPYSAVIPTWVENLASGNSVFINGDGNISRDFCYIDNVVQANILAGTIETPAVVGQTFNIAFGEETSLLSLFEMIRTRLEQLGAHVSREQLFIRDYRPGDIRNSLADISKAVNILHYSPTYSIREGLRDTVEWYYLRRKMNP